MNTDKIKGELITFRNPVGFHNDGILYESNNSKTTIIHIHGSYGNFYQNYFQRVMAKVYTKSGFNFLSFNLTCHDGFAEGYKNQNEFEYVGGAISEFSTCIADIEGAVQYANKFSDRIILQGHSLGCDRTVLYLLTSGQKLDFILLAPCDSYRLQSKWIESYSITIEEQIKRLKSDQDLLKDFDWLPIKEYGVYSTSDEYILPITRKALLSIMTDGPFKLFNIAHPCDFFINQNCFVYIGGQDNLQTESNEIMFSYFRKRVLKVEQCFIVAGDHLLKNYEEIVAQKIVTWLKTLNY